MVRISIRVSVRVSISCLKNNFLVVLVDSFCVATRRHLNHFVKLPRKL